ncbi:two-component system sensor histidine kinase NtrB [Geomonas propionica]|uniref:histidine kinase n=1 Tax=Geomonas propionica TaxID=2798582 RepID=A0ABS0YSX9_9BACT|nr:PAS domain-containing sensor histidine kinase [Geomonas propionica]MBJ6801086.1 PAS domain-containing protein [Geomonas propionica]
MQVRQPAGHHEQQASGTATRNPVRLLAELCQHLNAAPDPFEALGMLLQSAMEATNAAEARAGMVIDGDVVVTERSPVAIPTQLRRSDAATHTTYQRLSRQPEVRTSSDGSITIPLVDDGQGILAWIELKRAASAPFAQAEVELLEGMAAATALALETGRMRCEHRNSSRASDEANSLLSATIESTLDGIMAVDANGDIIAYNRRFIEMWEVEDEDLARGDSNDLLLSLLGKLKDPVLFFEKVSELYWQPEAESYDVVELRSGKCFERFSRPCLSEGKEAGRVWTFHDITELKKLENQLLHAQKMEAIGTLAGGIAHDFNNIMTAVIGYTDLLQREFSPPAPYRGFLENIHTASHRAIAVVKNLLTFSREETLPTAKLECNALLQNVGGLLTRLVGRDVDLVVNLSSAPQGVLVDQGQIEQVLVNLTTNARDAMPRGGSLTIDVADVELSVQELAGQHTAKPGPYVKISFSDTGLGIDEAATGRIFDPFYTTKEVGKGCGLGLSISYGIVKRHGGIIEVASRQDEGATFSVLLPKVDLNPVPGTLTLSPTTQSAETVLRAEVHSLTSPRPLGFIV